MIHKLASIHSSAKIHEEVSIGAYSVIGPEVEIGKGSKIHSHVVIEGPTFIGRDNEIFQFERIGYFIKDKTSNKSVALKLRINKMVSIYGAKS